VAFWDERWADLSLPPRPTVRDLDLSPAGWNSFVWTRPSATDPATALDCIADDYAIAYRLQQDQTYQRYVPGRADLSNMAAIDRYDSLLVLITESGAQCLDMPVDP
jgi:hypothetical protein